MSYLQIAKLHEVMCKDTEIQITEITKVLDEMSRITVFEL